MGSHPVDWIREDLVPIVLNTLNHVRLMDFPTLLNRDPKRIHHVTSRIQILMWQCSSVFVVR